VKRNHLHGLLFLSLAVSACAATQSSPRPATVTGVETASTPAPPHATCNRRRPAACVEPAPSYAEVIAPLLERRCFACHANGGMAADDHDFSHFETLHAQRNAVIAEISTCAMPLPQAPPLEESEAEVLLGWAACGAPQN
jgi:hypothetical protein